MPNRSATAESSSKGWKARKETKNHLRLEAGRAAHTSAADSTSARGGCVSLSHGLTAQQVGCTALSAGIQQPAQACHHLIERRAVRLPLRPALPAARTDASLLEHDLYQHNGCTAAQEHRQSKLSGTNSSSASCAHRISCTYASRPAQVSVSGPGSASRGGTSGRPPCLMVAITCAEGTMHSGLPCRSLQSARGPGATALHKLSARH